MSEDWSISPPLPDKVFPWEKYNLVTKEEVDAFFNSPEILVIKERMCDMGRRLWNREYVDGNGGNISVRVAQNLVLCSPTLCSKGFMRWRTSAWWTWKAARKRASAPPPAR